MTERVYTLRTARPEPNWRVDYRSALDAEQLAAVEAGPGPTLVLAGAGSGKTRTLVYRVARTLESGTPPEAILLLTFTNKAAREMLRRVDELCGGLVDTRRILGGTFHHVGHRLLREHASALGISESFTILDAEDARDLMAASIVDLGYATGPKRFPRPEIALELVSAAINTERTIPEVVADRRPQFASIGDKLARVATRFAERKHAMQVLDFDDLLLYWRLLLTERPEVRSLLQERFRAIFVDEFQDTNRLQGEITRRMAERWRNLTVVGDDAQSIYRFRGAEFANILEFPKTWPGCAVFRLTRNYRSTPQIVALANASIANNLRQFPKELVSQRGAGMPPALIPLRDASQQAELAAQRILELRDEGFPLREQAVLYRAHHHSMEIQLELTRRNIPYVVRSGVRFLEQAHIKDVLAFLKFVHNPMDELALKRAVKLFPGVGGAIAEDLWCELSRLGGAEGPLAALGRPEVKWALPPRAHMGWKQAEAVFNSLANAPGRRPGELVELVLQGGYEAYLNEQFLNGEVRTADVRQLAAYAAGFESLETFLAEVSLLSEFQSEEVVEGADPDERVTLSSIHQAKGLEWRAVFLVWLAEGRFPIAAALKRAEDEEEERRLFYVAVTRARDELNLTYPLTSSSRDDERTLLRVSRFIEELPEGAPLFERVRVLEEPAATAAPARISQQAEARGPIKSA